jgi:hypothetical protein
MPEPSGKPSGFTGKISSSLGKISGFTGKNQRFHWEKSAVSLGKSAVSNIYYPFLEIAGTKVGKISGNPSGFYFSQRDIVKKPTHLAALFMLEMEGSEHLDKIWRKKSAAKGVGSEVI